MSKEQWLIPANKETVIDNKWLCSHNNYFGLPLQRYESLSREATEKLFGSKYAYAEKVQWPGWKANKFYGEDAYQPNGTYDFVLVTIYGSIGPFENCKECGVVYRYLDISDLTYKCSCKIDNEEQRG